LREEQRVEAELKAWDDWAVQRAIHVFDKPENPSYPASMERAVLGTAAVKEYAPELLSLYESDPSFRQRVDKRLRFAMEEVALHCYKLQADANKAAILAYRTELEKLAAAGKLDRLVPLEDQIRHHPERWQLVDAAWQRINAEKEAALEKARTLGSGRLREEYRQVFLFIRSEASRQRGNEGMR